ncbi:MAG: hypothetical protein JRM95_05110 [Nitrososphaerota archaeon]|nr:hypothetical protein [Nitrososphaerota archaeon]MDG6974191.1 hypothetical protein [Nitrososphaerota archaeon]
MNIDPGILLAALGITMLELAEAAAVGLALFAESGRYAAFLYVAAGAAIVFAPTFLVGDFISLLPVLLVRLVGAVLLLYFGQRLARSARRSVVRSRTTGFPAEAFEKGLMYTGFSVGAVEAFEASIVLVGLIPENLGSAAVGFVAGIAVVAVATFVLRSQVRKIKQANMKVVVSGLLLTFSAFWFMEALVTASDLLLIPLFAVFVVAVHWFANRPTGLPAPGAEVPAAGSEAHK